MRRLSIVLVLVAAQTASAQDLGHRMVGTIGARAGEQRAAGLYVADRLLFYTASTFRDRRGEVLVTDGASVDALANGFGLAATLEIDEIDTYVSFTAAVPLARASVRSERAEASLDRFGLGDVYLMPLGLGWRLPHVDLVASYAIYVPTGLFRLGDGGLSRGHVTHELALGGTVFFDAERRFRVSALGSLDLNHPKIGVDITRGATVQVQGGLGALLFDLVDVGLIGAALWQVTDDGGADLPPALLGARDRVMGLGGEIAILVAPIHGRIAARYFWETGARSRPEGHLLVFELAIVAWDPDAPARAEPTRAEPPRPAPPCPEPAQGGGMTVASDGM